MMRLVTKDGQELVVEGELGLDIGNPGFEADNIPGTASDPLDLVWCEQNLVALNFPHLYRGPGAPPPVVVDCYLDGLRWRRAKLLFLSLDVVGRKLSYQLVADAADLADAIRDVKLDQLDLGTAPLDLTGHSPAYALLPVRNLTFYGDADKAPKGYSGYLNYVAPGAGGIAPGAPLAPMPYLVPIVRRVIALLGYTLTGSWADDPELQTAVLYSDRLCVDPGLVTLNRHVPSLDVADLLLGVAGLFCLQVYFNPLTREARFTPLAAVVAGAAAGARPRPGLRTATTANATTGYQLVQEPDGGDELDKTLDSSWQRLTVTAAGQVKLVPVVPATPTVPTPGLTQLLVPAAGGEVQTVKAGTLHLVTAIDGGRSWQVPAYEGKGAVPGNDEVGDESRVGLRLLFNRGYQPDSAGQGYPLGTPSTTNQHGSVVGNYDLRWAGPWGLYQVWHKPWLDFRSRAVQHVYQSALSAADLLSLDPSQADYVDYHLCFWEKISLTVPAGSALRQAEFTYWELL